MLLTDEERESIRRSTWPVTPYAIDRAFLPALVELETVGVAFDPTGLSEFESELDVQIEGAERYVEYLVGAKVNLRSVPQVAHLLFDTLELRAPRGVRSTGIEVLLALRGSHPVVEALIDHRAATKIKTTYCAKLRANAAAFGGRIMTVYNNTLVETGRLSSGSKARLGALSVNVQQIPKTKALGAPLRRHFVASQGNVLCVADLSQAQLRIAAVDSKDEAMIRAFGSEGDYHTQTAVDMFGDGKYRQIAKHLNFAMLFGASEGTVRLAIQRLGGDLKPSLVRAAYPLFFAARPQLFARIRQVHQDVLRTGFVDDLFGRRNYYRIDTDEPRHKRDEKQREAYNFLIQGPEASLAKLLSTMVLREVRERKLNGRLVLMVHDEVVLDVPKNERDATEAVLRDVENELNELIGWPVRVVVEAAFRRHWGAGYD